MGTTRSHARVFRSAILCAVILLVWAFLAPFLAERLIVERPADHADVIVVMAGSAAYRERTRKAALVYKNGIAPRILLTNDGEHAGWSQDEQRNPSVFELARRELVAHGVPDDAIVILPPKVTGTMMEARLLVRKAVESRWDSLLIVTSAYHTRRALWAFEKAFSESAIDVKIGIVPARIAQEMPPAFCWWFTWEGWRDVAGEYVKGVYYHFAY
jgi:uncharacterized SAM-binding protein YcdF (DUF218 family)